ncbi:carbamate kinase [Lentzea flaviverrucosa]|uniref:Carbamate kinase n=1 Tax=Lentzea flaviverrucosa TaxID=200379 RepID=A0A1H9XXR0_9PSEU|nr:carbamate kinase [Lentzea flaviverrucosa]RDI34292.1 carbamate kinase [Lentzea flaviverrucosa]SES50537.1 carbamate kinase [Lentzea flaviverrucosa]
MRIVVALGGNALLMRGERADASVQLHHVEAAARALAPLTAEHELVVCHGNGPQIGLLALESEADPSLTRPYPLDTLGAETQGMIGYWLAQSLRNAGVHKPVLAVVTQTVVDASDPAFSAPTKFIGPIYGHKPASRLAELNGWTMAEDGPHWRRVVPSPEPLRVVEQESIERLVSGGTIVVCAGGGGAPVVDDGQLHGVEAVVDKDLTSAALAIALKADRLLLLTDVPAVMSDYGLPTAEPLHHLDVTELEHLSFPAGSMGPKIEACRRFVQATGSVAAIGALTDVEALLLGDAGTSISQKPVS